MRKFLLLWLSLMLMLPITSTWAAEYIEAHPEGHMIVNDRFDEDLSDWQAAGSGDLEWSADGANGGVGSAKCVMTSKAGRYFGMRQPIQLIPGETYNVEFDAKTESGSIQLQLYAYYFSENTQQLYQSSSFSDEWTHFSGTFTVNSVSEDGSRLNDGECYLRFRARYQPADSYYIDNVKITSCGTLSQEQVDEFFVYDDPVAAPAEQSYVTFSDINNHWAQSTIELMAQEGNIDGVSELYFEPERKITRAEYLTLMINSFMLDAKKYDNIFKDVSKDDWYASTVQIAYELGLISNEMISDDMFYPEAAISRQEAASVTAAVLRLKGYTASDKQTYFADSHEISDWAAEDVALVLSLSVMNGYENGTFNPHGSLTRAESAQILFNIEELSGRWAYYVDYVSGDDTGNGTLSKPFKTVKQAVSALEKSTKDMKHNVYVYLKSGEHYIDETVKLNTNHSGTNGYDVVFTTYGGERADLVGGVHLNNWSVYDSQKGIYKAKLPGNIYYSRHLYVNGLRAVRARTEAGLENAKWTDRGVSTTDAFWATISKPDDLEAVYASKWVSPRLQVTGVEEKDGLYYLLHDPQWWSASSTMGSGRATTVPYYVENAYELIDSPGEFYIDLDDNSVYYMPRIFEDMSTCDAVVPTTETLLSMEGTVNNTTDDCIHNIVFDNIGFKYTTNYDIYELGARIDAQNSFFYTSKPADGKVLTKDEKYNNIHLGSGSVVGKNVKYIDFYDCDFAHLGNIGLKITGTVQNTNIERNNIYDISSNAISIGEINYGAGKEYLYQLEGKYENKNINISNNYMHTISKEYNSSLALSFNWCQDSTILNNEIFDVRAGGITFGWGWFDVTHSATDNLLVSRNYIHNVLNENLYDSGCIYNVGPMGEPYTAYNEISYNYMTDQFNRTGVMYPDQGSSNMHWKKNVIDLSMVDTWYADRGAGTRQIPTFAIDNNTTGTDQNITYEDNYTTTEHCQIATHSTVAEEALVYPDKDWPSEALEIIELSGLEKEYSTRFPEVAQSIVVTSDKFIRSGEFFNQPLSEVTTAFDNEVHVGDEFMLNVTVEGRKDTILDKDRVPVYFYSHDPDIVTVDASGKVTAVGKGTGTIDVYGLMDDEILKTVHVEIFVDDDIEVVEKMQVYAGSRSTLSKNVSAKSGRIVEGEVSYEIVSGSEHVEIVSGNDIKLNAISEGSAVIRQVITSGNSCTESEIAVEVLPAVAGGDNGIFGPGVEMLDMTSILSDTENWAISTKGGAEVLEVLDNGLGIGLCYGIYTGRSFLNEVFEFDMRHNWGEGGGWRCIMLRNQSADPKDTYKSGGYMILFDSDDCSKVALHRFNEGGTRTIFYGNMPGADSLVGDYLPSGMTEGETAQVKVGAINVPGGVRLVMTVNGETVFDIVDTSPDRIENEGYFMFYESVGRLDILYPTK